MHIKVSYLTLLIWQEMQKCFEEKDIGMLQEVVAKMKPEDAEYHIKRCIDSGKCYYMSNSATRQPEVEN